MGASKGVFLLLFFSSIFFISKTRAQTKASLVFYNVENLFDTEVDSTRSYKEFNPHQSKNWNNFKYYHKINQIAKTLAASTEDSLPTFIALAEIENLNVLQDLIQHPLLKKAKYEIIHFESRDPRGIDVAFLYKKNTFNLLAAAKITIPLKRPSRDILWVKGIHASTSDTLNFYVNHWSSRFGGKKKSETSRLTAARFLKHHADSLLEKNTSRKIIICGDFNDCPEDSSMKFLSNQEKLSNLFLKKLNRINHSKGTIKYKRQWQYFDQFVVSESMLQNKGVTVDSVAVFSPEWLLEEDTKYGGKKPFRSFVGPKYRGGYSDHLPIILYLFDRR